MSQDSKSGLKNNFSSNALIAEPEVISTEPSLEELSMLQEFLKQAGIETLPRMDPVVKDATREIAINNTMSYN